MTKQHQSAVVKAVLNWANFGEVNDLSGKYQVDCTQLSDEDADKLRTIGLEPKTCDNEEYNRGTYITPKSQVKGEDYRKNENDLRWFEVTFADKRPVENLFGIGNGTEAYVRIDAIPYVFKKKDGISAGLNRVVITKLVEFDAHNDEEMYEAAQEDLEDEVDMDSVEYSSEDEVV